VLVIVVLKLITHYLNWEFLELSSLFTALVSANIFLIGFLISGVLSDYKESERLPGDLACSLEAIVDECSILYEQKKSPAAKNCILHVHDLTESLIAWFHKQERTTAVMEKITGLNQFFLQFEPLTQANFIVRMKQEQNLIRRIITRIHTIRETDFNEGGYTIAEIITITLSVGLLFIQIDPFYESIFFIGFVSFILIYMLLLIKDLDNPFSHFDDTSLTQAVSLKPIVDLEYRLTELKAKIE